MITSPPGGSPAEDSEARKITRCCRQRLSQLTAADLQQLYCYAAHRMQGLNLRSLSGEDLVHDAVRQVLRGTLGVDHGRHPRWSEVADGSSFLCYLRLVVLSLIEAEYRSGAGRHHLGLVEELLDLPGETAGIQLVENVTPHDLVGFSQMSRALFGRLKARAPERLQGLVDAWEAHSDSLQQIPSAGRSRKDRRRLRQLAQRVYRELLNDRLEITREASSSAAQLNLMTS